MHSTIDQTLQVNLVNQSPVVPHTGGDIFAPNTGFISAVVDHLGVQGCMLIIAAIVTLLIGLIVFLLREKLTRKHKVAALVSTIALFAAALGFTIPATTRLSQAITDVENTVTINLTVDADAESAIASQATNLVIDQEYTDGYVVFAYTDEDNNLYNSEDRTAFFTNTNSSTIPDKLDMNSYGIKSKANFYDKLSVSPEHPTKITDTEDSITAGSIVPITYTAQADKTLPSGVYATDGAAVHFDIQPNIYYLNYEGYSTGEHKAEQKHNPVFTLDKAPTKTGYTFIEYNTKPDGTGDSYQPGDIFTVDYVRTTIYVIWEANHYNATFDANNGTFPGGGTTQQIDETYDSNYILPEQNPTRIGYTFDGWWTEPNGGTEVTADTIVTIASDHTIYAHWITNTHNISYDLSGGNYGKKHPDQGIYDADVEISNPIRTGYTFTGWTIAGMDTGTHYYGDTVEYGNTTTDVTIESTTATHFKNLHATQDSAVTFTANWQINTYILNFDADGGTGAPATKSQPGNPVFTIPTQQPTKAGYTFAGWASTKGATSPEYQPGRPITLAEPSSGTTSERTIYAVWQANTITVTFDHNDGSGAKDTKNETFGSKYVLPSNPTRSYYTFDGWYTAATGGTKVTTNTTVTNPNKHTLYAHWIGNQYKLIYNANSGSGGPGTVTQSGNPTFTVSGTKPTRSGYNFKGWADSSTATTAQYQAGDSITLTGSDKTIYAVWEDATPTMQKFTCSSLSSGASTQLKDARDGKMYWVTKLADGKCWMTQNLDLNLSSNTPLTPELSDISAGRSWTPQNTYTASSQWTSSNNTNINSLDPGDYYYDGTTVNTKPKTGASYSDFSGFSTTGNQHYHVGNLYSFNASTAGSGASVTASGAKAPDSICPKGWRLPTGSSSGEFQTLINVYGVGSTVQKLIDAPIYMARAGYVYSGILEFASAVDFYQSSTSCDSGSSYPLAFYTKSTVLTSDGYYRYYGRHVRCIAR